MVKRVSLTLILLAQVGCGVHKTESFANEKANGREVEVTGEAELIAALAVDDPVALAQALDKGLDRDYKFGDGQTLLIRAVQLKKIKIVGLLLNRGANVTATDAEGKAACDHAGNDGELRSLLKCPADPAVVEAAFEAVRTGQVRIVQSLLKEGLDPNLRNIEGDTLLIAAVKADQTKIIQMMLRGFLESGLDLEAKDAQGRTALTVAKELGLKMIVQLLEKSGAKG